MSATKVRAELERLAEIGNRSIHNGPRRIAEELRRHGVKGTRYEARSCPLAIHLSRFAGEAPVEVGVNEVTVGDDTIHFLKPTRDLSVVQDFVCDVDSGRFSYLLTPEGGEPR